jgi:hypothetical protein
VFDPGDELSHPLDYRLAVNGFVTLYWDPQVLAGAVSWLDEHGYRVARADSSRWLTVADMHDDLAMLMDFPDYYGRNFAALNDCLGDVASGYYGLPREATGLVLVLDGFDRFFARDREAAYGLLDVFATRARGAALFGHRMLCLAQSGDGRLSVPPVGATPVSWNDAEWLDSKRQH